MSTQFRTIRIRARDEFDWLMEHMTHEAYRVRDHWDVCGAMESALDEYSIELNMAPEFWELTRRAHQDAIILRLGRLYDPHPTATSLGNLLQTMKDGAIKPLTVLSPSISMLNAAGLDADMASVSSDDPMVEKLLLLRNEYLAHRSTRHVTRGSFSGLPTLGREEIAALIERALSILIGYRNKLGYNRLLWGHHASEEFLQLLPVVRSGRLSSCERSGA
jgi:hypothetical protein